MFGRILRNTFIAGEPVSKDDVVEVDDVTFRQLRACAKIETAPTPEGEEAAVEQAPTKFRKIKPRKPAAKPAEPAK